MEGMDIWVKANFPIMMCMLNFEHIYIFHLMSLVSKNVWMVLHLGGTTVNISAMDRKKSASGKQGSSAHQL